jgi:hypothetical protein
MGFPAGKERRPMVMEEGVHSEFRAVVNVGLEPDAQRFRSSLCPLLARTLEGILAL